MTPLQILYVDDDADLRTIVGMALSLDPTIVVRIAGSGEEAIAMARVRLPDVAVLDVMMPRMDGLALMDRLHRLPGGGALPVIFMTARTRAADVAGFRARGAIGVIPKPFDPIRLAEDILAMLRQATDGAGGGV